MGFLRICSLFSFFLFFGRLLWCVFPGVWILNSEKRSNKNLNFVFGSKIWYYSIYLFNFSLHKWSSDCILRVRFSVSLISCFILLIFEPVRWLAFIRVCFEHRSEPYNINTLSMLIRSFNATKKTHTGKQEKKKAIEFEKMFEEYSLLCAFVTLGLWKSFFLLSPEDNLKS